MANFLLIFPREINLEFCFISATENAQNLIFPDGMTSSQIGLGCDCTIFTGVTYLGSAAVNAPRSEAEINRNMAVFNDQSKMAIPVVLSVPNHSEGTV